MILKRMKILCSILVLMCTQSIVNAENTSIQYSGNGFDIAINESLLKCDGNIYSVGNTLYYPIRDISETLGFEVEWNGTTDTISVNTKSDKIFPYQDIEEEADESSALWGYKDINGNDITGCKYVNAAEMCSGLAKVQAGLDRQFKYGYINGLGEEVIPCVYAYARDFSEGIALVRTEDYDERNCFFINMNGELIIEKSFYAGEVGDFHKGYAPIMLQGIPYPVPDDSVEDVWSYMDVNGQIVTDLRFEFASNFNNNGHAYVKQNGKWGIIDTDFNIVIECNYDNYTDAGIALNTVNCEFGDFNISIDGITRYVSDNMVVVNGTTYLTLSDIEDLLGYEIDNKIYSHDQDTDPKKTLFLI